MQLKFLILPIIILIVAGCTTNSVLVSDNGLAPAPRKTHSPNLFLVDLAQMSGNTLYIDRKYFKESLSQYLKEHKASLEFNPDAHLIVNIKQNVLDENKFKTYYNGRLQYRIDRRLSVIVDYSMYGKSNYHNSFTYNVLVKSGSYVSFDDADRKAHIILFKKLGNMLGERVIALRHRFR